MISFVPLARGENLGRDAFSFFDRDLNPSILDDHDIGQNTYFIYISLYTNKFRRSISCQQLSLIYNSAV